MNAKRNANIRDIAKHNFTRKDRLFFDANIWVYLYGHGPRKGWVTNKYSAAFSKIISAKSTVYTDALVISEFVNAELRKEFSAFNYDKEETQKVTFKEFKQSPEGEAASSSIATTVNGKILSRCHITSVGTRKQDFESALTNFKGNPDFNDLMIANICKHQNLKLVTHDDGFKHLGVPLLTALPRLLR